MMENLVERFLRYVKIDTQSDESYSTMPSTEKQLELLRLLATELKEIGLEDVVLDENGYLMATLPANTDKTVPIIGFIAHVDTSPDLSGANVNPQITEYIGNNLVLDKKKNIVLSSRDFPFLNNYIGQKIITTDGSTLLGS